MKKKMIIITCLVLFCGPMVWAQEKVEAPVWNVGDRWTYKRADGVTWTDEVVDVKEDVFILKVRGSRDLKAYDKKTMNVKYLIEEGGKQVESDSGRRNLLYFPLFVGKKWADTSYAYATTEVRKSRGKTIFIHDFRIEGVEEVTTAAGAFKAYKIYYEETSRKTNASGWMRYWYSPEAKTWVKREVDKRRFWGTWAKDAELISYELK